jgi:hypothetical protein
MRSGKALTAKNDDKKACDLCDSDNRVTRQTPSCPARLNNLLFHESIYEQFMTYISQHLSRFKMDNDEVGASKQFWSVFAKP